MRQSVVPLRQSHLPNPVTNAAAAAKLLEKKKEFEAVLALETASAQFLKRIESLGDDFDVIADAGIVHGQVMDQWPQMFKILNLFMSQREHAAASAESAGEFTGERLVRIPLDDLQSAPQS